MNSPPLKIDYTKCTECGICAEECPNHVTLNGHAHVDHHYPSCDRCLHCYAVCPSNGISIPGHEEIPVRMNPGAEELLSLFRYRRSYRRFKDEPLSKNDIDTLIRAATFIPSGGNDHRMKITVLTDGEKRAVLLTAIHGYYKRIQKLLKNPFLKFIARRIGDAKVKATLKDPFYFMKILRHIEDIENLDDPVFYHAPAVFIFHSGRIMPTAKEDCILAAYNMVLMAETLMLGSCFVSLSQQAISNDKTCKEILSIPRSNRVGAVVIIGYPKRIYRRPAYRALKPVEFV